jgi:hypothetical protein
VSDEACTGCCMKSISCYEVASQGGRAGDSLSLKNSHLLGEIKLTAFKEVNGIIMFYLNIIFLVASYLFLIIIPLSLNSSCE